MGWSIGWDSNWKRDIGYGVPATCDHPGCGQEIDRGLSYVCGDDVRGGEYGCGLFFCLEHMDCPDTEDDDGRFHQRCERCMNQEPPFDPTPDTPEWVRWKLWDESWRQWRDENPEAVQAIRERLRTEATPPTDRGDGV